MATRMLNILGEDVEVTILRYTDGRCRVWCEDFVDGAPDAGYCPVGRGDTEEEAIEEFVENCTWHFERWREWEAELKRKRAEYAASKAAAECACGAEIERLGADRCEACGVVFENRRLAR